MTTRYPVTWRQEVVVHGRDISETLGMMRLLIYLRKRTLE